METYKSVAAEFIRSSQPETSVCTSTVAWRWGLASIMYCRHAMLRIETDQIYHAVLAITQSNSASSTSCLWWYIAACTVVRRRAILPGGPDHAVGRCNCQTWSQICCIYLSKVNMAAALVLYRPLAETFFVPKASTLPHVIVFLISTF